MFWLERRALAENLINVEAAKAGADDSQTELVATPVEMTLWQKTVQVYHEVDTIGLILLGFGWSLVSSLLLLVPVPLSETDSKSF